MNIRDVLLQVHVAVVYDYKSMLKTSVYTAYDLISIFIRSRALVTNVHS